MRGYHCDAYGHVNNARYLEFYEEGRWSFLQPAIADHIFEEMNLWFVVVNINVSYKAPIHPNDEIVVRTKGMKFNNMSMVIEQEISKSDTICSTALVSFVLLDKESQRPVAITEDIKNIFIDLLNEP